MSFHAAKRLVAYSFLPPQYTAIIANNSHVLTLCGSHIHPLTTRSHIHPLTIRGSHIHSASLLLTKGESTRWKSKSSVTLAGPKSNSSLVDRLTSTCSWADPQRRTFQTPSQHASQHASQHTSQHARDVLTAASEIDSVDVRSGNIVLSVSNGAMEIPLLWLRDHCHCPLCFNHETIQKKDRTKLMELNLSDAKVELNGSKDSLTIFWNDGHQSTFSMGELQEWFSSHKYRQGPKPFLWDQASLGRRSTPSVSYQEHVNSESGLKETISNLANYGFTFVDECPANVEATETVSERVGRLMPTLYSKGSWILSSEQPDHADTAYTNVSIGAHTDMTYYTAAAGIQVFHCLEHRGEGGATLLVDGFHAAQRLLEQDPQAFDCLTKSVIPHEFREAKSQTSPGYHLYNLCTVLTTFPNTHELVQIRFNPYDRAPLNTLSVDQIPEFYAAYDKLSRIIQDPANEYWVKLTPGRVLFIDNWRVMHGRATFSGLRTLCGCYLQRDEWVSKARVMDTF